MTYLIFIVVTNNTFTLTTLNTTILGYTMACTITILGKRLVSGSFVRHS